MATPAGDGCDATGADGDRVPLVALLGRLEAAFIAEFDRRIAESEFCALSLAHSRNVLRHVSSEPKRAIELAAISGVSKQAISQQLVHLEANGYVTLEPCPGDARARLVTLTDRGRAAQRLVKELFAEIEGDWFAEIGARDGASVRRILTKLATAVHAPCS